MATANNSKSNVSLARSNDSKTRIGSDSPASDIYSKVSAPGSDTLAAGSVESGKLNLGSPTFLPSATGNRFSLASNYSGVVHNADIDTIRYVVNDSSSRQMTHGRRSMFRTSEVRTVGSGLGHRDSYRSNTSTARTLNSSASQGPEASSIREAVVLPTTKGESASKSEENSGSPPDKENSVDLEYSVPARSSRRPISACIEDMESIMEGASIESAHSVPSSCRTSLIGPRTLRDKESSPSLGDNASMQHSRIFSQKLNGQFDKLMQQVESLKTELDANPQIPSSESSPSKESLKGYSDSSSHYSNSCPSSKRNSFMSESPSVTQTSTASYHTAVSDENDWEDEGVIPPLESDDIGAENSSYAATFTRDPTLTGRTKSVRTLVTRASREMSQRSAPPIRETLDRSSTFTASPLSRMDTKAKSMPIETTSAKTETVKAAKSGSVESFSSTQTSIQPSPQDSGSTKALNIVSSTSDSVEVQPVAEGDIPVQSSKVNQSYPKSKPAYTSSTTEKPLSKNISRRSNLSSSKRQSRHQSKGVSSFSYDTLARLLNATDGIVIGQEFASLNMPVEEKYLLEKIVGSISRLTANMMLDPQRFDKSYARLQKALNILEGFD